MRKGILLGTICGLGVPAAALAGLPPGSIRTVGVAHSHSVSIPLVQMATCPNASQSNLGAGPMSPFVENFEGMHLSELLGGGCSLGGNFNPTDDSGAAGLYDFVQVNNTAISVYDKLGDRLAGPVSTSTFFSNQPDCGGGQIWTDAVVIYDQNADRWLISRPGGPNGADLCLAISQSPDPTGAYDEYAFPVNNAQNGLAAYFNDYPKIATWTNSYLSSADPNKIFSGLGNTFSAFDRKAMLAGEASPSFVTFFVPAPASPNTRSHVLPVNLDGYRRPPQGAPAYFAQVQDQNLGFSAGRIQAYELSVNWTDPSASTLVPSVSLTPDSFNSNACPAQSCIPQPSGSNLDSLSYGYMMFRASYRRFNDHQTIVLNHTVAADGDPTHNQAGIRWYELRRTKSTQWSIFQQGTYAPDANSRWLGSIAMDHNGNIALGFDVSGKTLFPSIRIAGRTPSDPAGMLPRGEYSVMDGAGAQQNGIFFGDYSQMTVDPDDDCTFWFTSTYYPATSNPDDWHTRIAAFQFPGCRCEGSRCGSRRRDYFGR